MLSVPGRKTKTKGSRTLFEDGASSNEEDEDRPRPSMPEPVRSKKTGWDLIHTKLTSILPMTWKGKAQTPVTLHVYNVITNPIVRRVNHVCRVLGSGAYHAAVEVNGKEWSFGATSDGDTGVFWNEPEKCEVHSYREAVPLGKTSLSSNQVYDVLVDMSEGWQGADYDLLRRNCCHFSREFCEELKVGPFPTWVLALSATGASLEATYGETVARGKGVRGMSSQRSTKFGDLTRGIVALGQDARGGHRKSASSKRLSLRSKPSALARIANFICCPCDCSVGLFRMCCCRGTGVRGSPADPAKSGMLRRKSCISRLASPGSDCATSEEDLDDEPEEKLEYKRK